MAAVRKRPSSVPWVYKVYETFHGKEFHYRTCPCARCTEARAQFRASTEAKK